MVKIPFSRFFLLHDDAFDTGTLVLVRFEWVIVCKGTLLGATEDTLKEDCKLTLGLTGGDAGEESAIPIVVPTFSGRKAG